MNSIVDTIKHNSNRKFVNIIDVIPSRIASLFSVLFALSIVFELRNLIDGFVLVMLGIFIILFLIANEYVKVLMVKRLFSKQIKGSIIPFIITFFLSASLSSIGIWMWTNKTVEHKTKNNVQNVTVLNKMNNKFDLKIDSIRNIQFESTQEYKDLIKTIEYWKSRKAMDSDELKLNRSRLDNVQTSLDNKRTMFNVRQSEMIGTIEGRKEREAIGQRTMFKAEENKTEKNSFISYIFLSLILITELAIIILNKLLAEKEMILNKFISSDDSKQYLIERNLLDTMFITKKKGDKMSINDVKYCPSARTFEWEELTVFYNTLIGIGILSDPLKRKKVLTNNVQVDNVQALTMFDAYHEKKFKYDIELNC